MKYMLLPALFFTIFSININAQVVVSDDNTSITPDPSAILDVKGNSGGLLFPRLTTEEQRMISHPAAGLVIFNTDSSDFYGFDGTVWKALWDHPTDTISRYCPDSIEYFGQWYSTVQIFSQCWFAENLNYATGNSWCYEDNPAYCDTNGRFYDWITALNACPAGWHLPSDAEWKVLEGNVDTQFGIGDEEWNLLNWRGSDVGLRLKSTNHWGSAGNGTDAFGFAALPGGYRGNDGTFYHLDLYGLWWTSTTVGTLAWYRNLYSEDDRIDRNHAHKSNCFSVRCIKD